MAKLDNKNKNLKEVIEEVAQTLEFDIKESIYCHPYGDNVNYQMVEDIENSLNGCKCMVDITYVLMDLVDKYKEIPSIKELLEKHKVTSLLGLEELHFDLMYGYLS